MPRITRIAGSFTIVVIVYWVYALAAVPLIEPAADPRSDAEITEHEQARGAKLVDMQMEQLQGLFPQGAWELQNPKILESDRAKLLFREYKNHPDGRVELHPCTIVFDYEGEAENEEQRRRQSVILEAPAGAVLQFDQPLDLNRAKIGRLVRGQLNKEVRIRSDWKSPSPEDDLLIVTHDILLTEQTIATPNQVDFRWGRHFGRGQDMVIKLLSGPSKPGMKNAGPNIAGIESFEMRRIERLHLDLGQTEPNRTPAQKVGSLPVEINCRGPFCFNVVSRVATFRDGVDVMKANLSGPADRLNCDVLSVHFTDRTKEKNASTSNAAGSLDLAAERIVAQGKPVVVTAPSRDVIARAEWLEYNMLTNSIAMRDNREVFLQQGPQEVHARSLYYQATNTGRLGFLKSQGPGWLRGQSPDRPDQKLEAYWKEFLQIDRDQQEPRISLTGGAELRFPGKAQLQSQQIFLWLRETPSATQQQQFERHPSRMAARGEVRMNAAQLACRVEDLQVWFEEKGEGGRGKGDEGREMDGSPPIQTANHPSSPQQAGAVPGTTIPGIGRIQVDGRLLTAKIALTAPQPIVSNLTIKDGVRFQEIQTSQPSERPLLILGDLLVAENLSEPNATVTVTGRQARFEGRGLGLSGANINLDRGANRLWINGPGQMDLPLSKNQQAPASTGGVLTVDWQRGMNFDGRTAQFADSVVASARQLQVEDKTMNVELKTGKMDVQLQRPVSFSQPQAQEPTVQTIQCSGGVKIENRSFDRQQQLSSHDQMQVTDLGVDLMSGEMNGGPGWINSVYSGSIDATENPAAKGASPSHPFNCLRLRFQRSIKGNVIGRQLTFDDQVRLIYAPVDNWDTVLATDNIDKLGPSGVGAHCDLLSINQPLLPLGGQRSVELVAQGNAVVENATYTARGYRITYNQAKELLILQGDGRNDAELFQQLQPGAPTDNHAAQEIHYWRKTGHVKVIGARSLQIGQPPRGNRLK